MKRCTKWSKLGKLSKACSFRFLSGSLSLQMEGCAFPPGIGRAHLSRESVMISLREKSEIHPVHAISQIPSA